MLPKSLPLTIVVDGPALLVEESADSGAPFYLVTVHINDVPHALAIFPVEEHGPDARERQTAAPGFSAWYEGIQMIEEVPELATLRIADQPFVCVVTPHEA